MDVDAAAARELFASARVARLATVGADGRPHLVPITFAVDGDCVYTAVDHKPKGTDRLRRLANVAAEPRVSLLADHYDDQDWSALWWARADGAGRIAWPGEEEHEAAVAFLGGRYRQYRCQPPAGPAIVISVSKWRGWRADGHELSSQR
jgi:PPOX class probable F420-dependent enzyme